MALEVTGEMRLIKETNSHSDICGPGSDQEHPSGSFDATTNEISVGADPESGGEATDHMGHGPIEGSCCPIERDRLH